MISQSAGNEEHHGVLRSRATDVPNLQFLENVDSDEIHRYFRSACVLVNTSRYEGFPNTFLEAWRYETPIVSLSYSLNEAFRRTEIGIRSGSMDSLVRDVKGLWNSPRERAKRGEAGREYMYDRYSLSSVADRYVQVFQEIVDS